MGILTTYRIVHLKFSSVICGSCKMRADVDCVGDERPDIARNFSESKIQQKHGKICIIIMLYNIGASVVSVVVCVIYINVWALVFRMLLISIELR